MKISLNDRYQGTLLGLVVDDALGTTLEFSRPGTFTLITDERRTQQNVPAARTLISRSIHN